MSDFFSPSVSGEKRSFKSGLCVPTQHEFNNRFFPFQDSQFFQFSQVTFVPKAQKRIRDGEEILDPKTGSWTENQQMDSQKQVKSENFSFLNPQSNQKKTEKFSNTSSFQQKSFFPRSGPKNSFSNSRLAETQKQQQVVSITYEEIGLFPRSFNRVFDRFFKQLFFDVENFVIQEYRFYRYLFLTTVKCLFILLFVPLSINFLAKNYFIRPITEYFWNTQNHEIFLNSYQQKKAFSEFKNFEEKIYFESFLFSDTSNSGISEKEVNFEKSKKEFSGLSFSQTSNLSVDETLIGLPLSQNSKNQKHITVLGTNFDSEKTPKSKRGENDFYSSASYLPAYDNRDALNVNPVLNTMNNERGFVNDYQNRGDTTMNSSAQMHGQRAVHSVVQRNLEGENQTKISPAPLKQSSLSQVGQTTSEKAIVYASLESNFSTNFQNSLQKRLQIKIFELAKHYNEESIEAVTNFFADILSFGTLWFLLVRLEIQINITKSFLLEVFFGLDDSKKSLLILFLTDLLVGYHSPNIWELFFQTLFDHYGLPESQTTIFLLVATLPVLLDVLFKYLIFRHLNRASPATVATYHAMIE